MVIGSGLTLVTIALALVLTKPSNETPEPSLPHQTTQSSDKENLDEIDNLYQYSGTTPTAKHDKEAARSPTLETETPIEKKQCLDDCLTNLTEQLVSGAYIDGSDLQLASDNAQRLANYLVSNPNQLLNFEAALDTLNNPQDREVLLFVISKLPKEQLLQSAQRLTYSHAPEDRIAGLSLLEASIGSDTHIAYELNTLIYNETDNDVLMRAFKVIDGLSPDEIDTATLTKLSTLIENGETEKIKSAALMAKISVTKNDEEIRANVSNVLEAQSNNMKLVGLQALDTILARQKYKPEHGNWEQDTEFETQVSNIANDITAQPKLRIEALNLLNRHYKNS